MPVLSLPLPFAGQMSQIMCFPIRIPFPTMMRIGSILPCSMSEPLKDALLSLFKLAWSNKVQLPVLITVAFLALDIRLQLEINIFWEPPRNGPRQRDREHRAVNVQRHSEAALVAATLVTRERLRVQERARQLRRDIEEMAATRRSNHHHTSNRILNDDDNTDTDSDLEISHDEQNLTTPEKRKKLRKKKAILKYTSNSTTTTTDSEDTENENTEDSSDDDDIQYTSDEENNDDDDNGDGGARPGGSGPSLGGFDDEFFGGGESTDSNDDDSGGTPLVVELEIRQRPVFSVVKNNFSTDILKHGIAITHLYKYELVPYHPAVTPDSLNSSHSF